MLSSTAAYKAAITGDSRRMLLRAIVDISDPDLTWGTVTGTSHAGEPWSRPEQLYDKTFATDEPTITLEHNRWILNGTNRAAEIDEREIGYAGDTLSDASGNFSSGVYVQLGFANVSILQACSVWFSTAPEDGIPVDFTVTVRTGTNGATAAYTKSFSGNTATHVSVTGFTVNNPTAIRLTVTRWSLPFRRLRAVEILPGIYEDWRNDIISQFSATLQTAFSGLSLPYGTCTLQMDNSDRRFTPRSKGGAFQSLEERQPITVSLGTRLEDGTDEYKPLGVFYMANGGWTTGSNSLGIKWDLVDIIGLLSSRSFVIPGTLPTTLSGWIQAIVSQLGTNFSNRFIVNGNKASYGLTTTAESLKNLKCGDILRYACMASQTWPRADATTGYLRIETLPTGGQSVTLDNMAKYPTISANDELASITFTLANNVQYTVAGPNPSSSNAVNITNPFITTQAQASTAATWISRFYGGNQYEVTGRGDPASELGDVDTVYLYDKQPVSARRISQSFRFQNFVLKDNQSVFLGV